MRNVTGVALAVLLAGAGPALAGAVITNGSGVYLGVNDQGHLNFSGGLTPVNAGAMGVSITFPDGSIRDATSPGCLCEGWGVAVNGATSGYANVSSDGGAVNLTVSSFTSTASTATSTVSLTSLPGLTVTQAYAPSSSSALFVNTVTITNGTAATVTDVRYRRVMDWDVPPTEFDEYVTIAGWPATALLATSDNGFATANPLGGGVSDLFSCGVNVNFTKCGIDDHGALFDFGFGSLAAGESKTFRIFYGAAFGEGAILSALGSVGAEVYSLGFASDGPGGAPNTTGAVYAFGFAGVGGTPIEPVPEPGTLLLLGSGVTALIARRRRSA